MVSVVIGAAGKSERFGSNKMQTILAGLPLLMRTIYPFQILKEIDEIILVVPEDKIEEMSPLKKSFTKIKKLIPGGKTRFESIAKGVIETNGEICLVHNGANPLVTKEEILETIKSVRKHNAAFIGRKITSTLWEVNNGLIEKNIPREDVYEAETPQGFKRDLFINALEKCKNKKKEFTDEMSVLENIGIFGKVVKASPQNRKITTVQDLQIAEVFFKAHTRIGIGHDSHKFSLKKEKPLLIGGAEIPYNKSFSANSDGDVVIHSLCNAIGTAIGEGSLSLYADKMCHEGIIDSLKYLEHINKNMKSVGYSIGNIAITIEGKEPKLENHIPNMKKIIAETLGINSFQIGIACTSGEELTSFGKGEGIQCFCHVQLIKIS